MRVLPRGCLAALACLLTVVPAAAGHDGEQLPAPDHRDPRAELPDSLVTQPVAQAELASPQLGRTLGGPGLPETWCGGETTVDGTVNQTVGPGTPHFKLIYAYAADQTSRFSLWQDRLQANVSLLGRYMATQSGGSKSLRWDMGTSCGPEYVDIQVVQLPDTLAQYNDNVSARFDEIRADLGTPAIARNVVVYLDGFATGGIGGEGSLWLNSSPTTTQHDTGRLHAFVYGPANPPAGTSYVWPSVMLHEMGHNLGAVQNDAPNATGYGHCVDEADVMCYADGPGVVTVQQCGTISGSINETFDCNGDDYFNPDPAPGSYLDTHWNVYGSGHLGGCAIELTEACGVVADGTDILAPVNETPLPPSGWTAEPYTVTLTGTDVGSSVDAWEWRVGNGPVQTTQQATIAASGTFSLRTRVRDVVGNWSEWRTDTVRVDMTGPTASISCPSAWGTSVSCTVTASDPESGIATRSARVDGGSAQPLSGTIFTLTSGGEHGVEARAVNAAGIASGWSSAATARVDATAPVVSFSCPSGWLTVAAACELAASDPESGVAARRVSVDGGGWASFTGDAILGEGNHAVAALAVNGAGAESAIAAAGYRLDVSAPSVTLTCSAIDDGLHRCTPEATDAGSGVAAAQRLRDGAAGDGVTPGSPFEVEGPATVSVSVTDGVGRTAVSNEVTVTGPDDGAGAAGPPPVQPFAARTAAATATLRAGRRTVGKGAVELLEQRSGRRVVAVLRPGRLPAGTWKLKVCVAGARCTAKTVTLRRAGRPKPLRVRLRAPAAETRVTFTLARRRGAKFRRYAAGATSAALR